jgi:dolichol-phosphate mannosyltransferase
LIVGPDEASAQWVADVGERARTPWVALTKIRHGDRDVEVSVPDVKRYVDHTRVILDDIVSSARTMVQATCSLVSAGLAAPVCVGVHAVFAGDAHRALVEAGAARIVTTDRIPHPSNGIGIAALLCARAGRAGCIVVRSAHLVSRCDCLLNPARGTGGPPAALILFTSYAEADRLRSFPGTLRAPGPAESRGSSLSAHAPDPGSERTAGDPSAGVARSLVVVPTYDEAENILPLVGEVLAAAPGLEVLVVDDASPDGTGDLVAERMLEEPRLHLLRREGKLGLGTAYLAGFRYGLDHDFDRVFTMDADFSHNPRYIPQMLAAMERFDVVIGSRYVKGGGIVNWPLFRRVLSRFANLYARVLLRLPVRDCTAGFRCYAAEVLETVDPFAIRASGYSFLEEMAFRVCRAGFRVGEIPIVFEDRRAGSSKIDSPEIYRAAWHVLATAIRPPPLPDRAAVAHRRAGPR